VYQEVENQAKKEKITNGFFFLLQNKMITSFIDKRLLHSPFGHRIGTDLNRKGYFICSQINHLTRH